MSVGNRGGNLSNREENQLGLWKDPNTMNINKRREGNRTCYYCGKFGHMA